MIGAHIIYNMWKNVGNHPTFAMVGENETKKDRKVYHRLDWSGSDVGLFIGLLALVTLTITLILYFSLVSQEEYHLIAVLIIMMPFSMLRGKLTGSTLLEFGSSPSLGQ